MTEKSVSMKSGLRDRNNMRKRGKDVTRGDIVSMKSGLRDRNNRLRRGAPDGAQNRVSMKSGLRDRNNSSKAASALFSIGSSQ